jgi:hypothetical protein
MISEVERPYRVEARLVTRNNEKILTKGCRFIPVELGKWIVRVFNFDELSRDIYVYDNDEFQRIYQPTDKKSRMLAAIANHIYLMKFTADLMEKSL